MGEIHRTTNVGKREYALSNYLNFLEDSVISCHKFDGLKLRNFYLVMPNMQYWEAWYRFL